MATIPKVIFNKKKNIYILMVLNRAYINPISCFLAYLCTKDYSPSKYLLYKV